MQSISTGGKADTRQTAAKTSNAVRVAYFVSHPIQYQAPMLRRIAQEPDIDLTVFFSSDLSVRGYKDSGFGVAVKWDVPLLDGYKHEFLPRLGDGDKLGFAKPLNWGIFGRLRKGKFDAVWVFGYHRLACLHAIFAAKLLGLPVIIRTESNLHDHVRSKTKLAIKRVFFGMLRTGTDCVLSIGKSNRKYWEHYFGKNFPSFPTPYAVDNEFFHRKALEAAPRREQFRSELGLEPGRPVILYASKLQTRKRCVDLVEAYIQNAPGLGMDPPAYLLIVGDGEERANLEARVRESRLTSIRFLGFRNQTELPRLYDLCDVFVLPSYDETWGLVVNEVMNAGRAIIVTDQVGCQPDLVQDGFNGFVYPAFDVDALAQGLRQLIDDPTRRAAMGENSLRIIQQHSFEQDIAGLRKALASVSPGFAA
ncbi:MAG TPA: glycosyltransferase family 4 protein [Acidobacteriaceae bacterium]|jgi:glycosyltransferase involved in cell wall biosynthesis|nr:glycosyltransferase family 4 protein [Acidobacteriaceae bacterium]